MNHFSQQLNMSHISQCKPLDAAVYFAELIDLPLNAHLTIHWVGTDAGDDPNGAIFAKVRDGIARWLRRSIKLTARTRS